VSRHAHLIEERLFDCYLAERGGDTIDPRLAEHLTDCEACAARYTELAAFMDGLHEEGVAEADAAFGPDRLRAQQQLIARRLELVGHPARILSFPRRIVRGTMTPASSHSAPRWIAAAAAAGLFIGVAVGASYNFGARRSLSEQMARASVPANRSPAVNPSTPVHGLNPASPDPGIPGNSAVAVATGGDQPGAVASDDAFLSDLELALERPHTRELQAFDALTPHVREIGLRR
jgi:hypothetical protein